MAISETKIVLYQTYKGQYTYRHTAP